MTTFKKIKVTEESNFSFGIIHHDGADADWFIEVSGANDADNLILIFDSIQAMQQFVVNSQDAVCKWAMRDRKSNTESDS